MRVVTIAAEDDFAGWRDAARGLALADVPAEDVVWQVGAPSDDLFGETVPPMSPTPAGAFSVPPAFLTLAETVVRHQDPERFGLLYALLLRLREKPHALNDGADPLVRRVERMAKEVRHEQYRKDRPQAGSTGPQEGTTMARPRSKLGAGANALAAWEALREESRACTRCHLYKHATQTVFGEGPLDARIMFVGEQPGDQEDLAGRPFVGPAGQLFDRALKDAGVDRAATYVTNAVKHFKFEQRGKRRIHSKPQAPEIEACRWWIEQEQLLVGPPVTVALGATAARSLFGKAVTISATRGRPHDLADGGETWVTVHPSFLLRVRDDKEAEYARFVDDLRRIGARAKTLA